MDPRQLLEENLELIDRVARRACFRAGIAPDQVDDVGSMLKLALVENDYAILRRYEGRSSLATYLAIVVQRTLADQRERVHGRWRPSPEAQRLGRRAVVIEDVIGRQRRSIEEALPFVRAADPAITHAEIVAIADRLPARAARPREVALPPEEAVPLAAGDRADTAALDSELRDVSRRAGALMRETMAAWPDDDRLLLRLRFESSLSVADIARLMAVPQRPLYRRIELLLGQMREALQGAGIDSATVGDLLGAAERADMDLGPIWRKSGSYRAEEQSR